MLRYAPSPYRLTYERPALNSGSDWEPYCCSVRARMPVLISRCARQFESARDYHQRPRPSSFAWLANLATENALRLPPSLHLHQPHRPIWNAAGCDRKGQKDHILASIVRRVQKELACRKKQHGFNRNHSKWRKFGLNRRANLHTAKVM